MDVPVPWGERRGQRQLAKILRQPQQDGERSPQRAAKEKWAEPVGEQGRSGVFAAAPQRGGHAGCTLNHFIKAYYQQPPTL